MKSFYLAIGLCACACVAGAQTRKSLMDTSLLEPVEVKAVRASDKAPIAKTNLTKEEIQQKNIGQDLPFILNQTPSVVVNSDAGTGIGYTNIRLRGSDASRINVTLNGIPYNDAESQGTFFVDLPDIASSANSIQVQRGVGTSSNGAGAFGGSINISTNDVVTKKSIEFNNSIGSYDSYKNSLLFNSGIFAKHLSFTGRLSNISSNGYIDRAFSRLHSFYTSLAYIGAKSSYRINIFSGKEKTYQAWNGIDEATLQTDRRYNSAGTEKPGTPYSNETDNYLQTHYQFFYNHQFNASWKMNAALFLTRGKGYYEQYKSQAALSKYGLPYYIMGTDTTFKTDLIRRLWLDNYFYGGIFSLQYQHQNTQIIIGAGANKYDGKHYGNIIWAQAQYAVPNNYRYYYNPAHKEDYSAYTKWTQQLTGKWQTYADLQVRAIQYSIDGFKDNPTVSIQKNYFFFNPKAGITYSNNNLQAYLSYGRSSHEPNRDDFEAGATQQPKPETLNDFETGIEKKNGKYNWGVNLYYMLYKNQLVLTGKINDVGAYTRTNIDNSYRAGIEIQAGHKITKWLSASGNLSLSENKIKNYTAFIDDYDNGGQQTKFYSHPDISFSPAVVGAGTISIVPVKNAGIYVIGKYVSRQYLDNTSSKSSSLSPYYVQDIKLTYTLAGHTIKDALFFIQVNNIFSKKYEPNGYSYNYISGGQLVYDNYYFPMAPINFMAGINIRL
ncbi:MAG: TonB-dependent receptor [Bacteroidetes bacterium]|nr:TonB-dependent receptor [Bacteroidota bacterium]MBS1756548.1 TonB-dependent receptor [Bacteroidota bacterium]